MSVPSGDPTASVVMQRFTALEAEVEQISGDIDSLGQKAGELRRSLDHLSATLARVPRRALWRRQRRH